MRSWVQKFKQYIPQPVWLAVRGIYSRWFEPCGKLSYAQNGEDMILDWHLDGEVGFYVDVGAHHPKRFSNTYRLYRRGWRGLNIDANPGSMRAFRRIRPRDINVEAAVSSSSQKLTYYLFREPGLNTLDRSLALQHVGEGRPIVKEIGTVTVPLVELLERYVPPNTRIDLLTVDVEGLDFDVLSSNDWERYSPDYVLVECLDVLTLDKVASNRVTEFLLDHHYSSVAKTIHTVLYKRIDG